MKPFIPILLTAQQRAALLEDLAGIDFRPAIPAPPATAMEAPRPDAEPAHAVDPDPITGAGR